MTVYFVNIQCLRNQKLSARDLESDIVQNIKQKVWSLTPELQEEDQTMGRTYLVLREDLGPVSRFYKSSFGKDLL